MLVRTTTHNRLREQYYSDEDLPCPGGMSEFLEYVRAKCKEGVGGDHPELQAMCEV